MISKLQQIQTKRGAYERKRRKRWLYFKNTGRLDLYYAKRLNAIKKEREKLFEQLKKRRMPLWRRVIISIERFFYNVFIYRKRKTA